MSCEISCQPEDSLNIHVGAIEGFSEYYPVYFNVKKNLLCKFRKSHFEMASLYPCQSKLIPKNVDWQKQIV
jgi:hypothetical protein